ncbi:MAG: PAS domain S-box protein [Methanoregula sp.]|nr:PAS domain S-box protein [Methanoregula sp.]
MKEFLKKNSRGMNIREISDALQINRNSLAKYLDVLTTREEVECKIFGKSKVYYLSQLVPVSTLNNFSSNLMVILNRDRQIVQINDAFLRHLDLPREMIIGQIIGDIRCDLLMNDSVHRWIMESLLGNEISDEICIPGDGSRQHFRVVLTNTLFPDNTPGVIIFFENITEKKQIKSALAESEENFRILIEESGDGCVIIDEEGTIIAWNPALEQICGISSGETIGSNILEIICGLIVPEHLSKKNIEHMQKSVTSAFQKKSTQILQMPDEIPIIMRNGERKHIQKLAFPIRLGEKMHLGVIIKDISKRKTADELLRKSEEKYRRIVETANEGIWAMDRNFTTTFVNRKLADLLGYSVEEMIGKLVPDFMHPDELDDNAIRMRNRMDGIKEAYERRFEKKDGTTCWILVSVTPVTTADGTFDGSFAMMTDITERREAEQVLRESEERFHHLIDHIPGLAVQGYFEDGTTFYWNKTSERLYGYTAEEAIGKNLLDLIILPEMREEMKSAIAGMVASGQPIPSADLSLRRKDGTWVDVYSGHIIIQIRGKPLQLFCMDIDLTERKEADRAIRESEDRFQQVADNSNEWIWEVDAEGTYLYSSAAVEKILGYAPDEIVGKMHYSDLFLPTSQEELKQFALAEFLKRKPFYKFINSALHKNGSAVILETSGSPVYDNQGVFTGYRGCDTDVTERRNMESARQVALDQIEKNIGQLAMLGDHIRNPLTAILGYTGMMSPEAEEKIAAQVMEIDRIISRIDQGWIESEKVRTFLRKNYDISLPGTPYPKQDKSSGTGSTKNTNT